MMWLFTENVIPTPRVRGVGGWDGLLSFLAINSPPSLLPILSPSLFLFRVSTFLAVETAVGPTQQQLLAARRVHVSAFLAVEQPWAPHFSSCWLLGTPPLPISSILQQLLAASQALPPPNSQAAPCWLIQPAPPLPIPSRHLLVG